MTATLTETIDPRAWVGCLACYNDGRLTGAWLDADDLDSLATDPDDEGSPTICTRPGHEELWVMDHENLGIDGECSVQEAATRARAIEALAEQAAEQCIPFPVALEYVTDAEPDPDAWPSTIENNYQGCADSQTDYAYEYAEMAGLPELPNWLVVDWHHTFDELTQGASVIYYDGTLYVFEG